MPRVKPVWKYGQDTVHHFCRSRGVLYEIGWRSDWIDWREPESTFQHLKLRYQDLGWEVLGPAPPEATANPVSDDLPDREFDISYTVTLRRLVVPVSDLPAHSLFWLLLEHGVELEVPKAWRTGTDPDDVQRSHCYREAFYYFVESHPELSDARLVHGKVWSPEQGEWIGHAWVEISGDKVFDGVLQRFFDRDSYRRLTRATDEVVYTRAEARLHRERSRSQRSLAPFGPWTDRLSDPPSF